MVIIGVREGYREVGLVAMRIGCAEMAAVVENLWNARFALQSRGFWSGWCGNLLFHVEQFSGADGEKKAAIAKPFAVAGGFGDAGMFHVEHYRQKKHSHLRLKRFIDPAIQFSDASAAGG
jgi:hypothetical protein